MLGVVSVDGKCERDGIVRKYAYFCSFFLGKEGTRCVNGVVVVGDGDVYVDK